MSPHLKGVFTTSFYLEPQTGRIDHVRHMGLPLVRTLDRGAAIMFQRNPDANRCIVSVRIDPSEIAVYRRDAMSEDEWQALRERKGT